jgi:putative ABC transport system permease protein
MSQIAQDLAHAARRLWRRPAFTAVAAGTLALGIGGAVAIFSVARAVVLRPLPYAAPDRLAMLWQRDAERGQPFVEMSYPAFRDWRASNPSFEDMAGLPSTNQTWTLSGRGEPVALVGRLVSWSFFDVLGVKPALGRTLAADDDRRGAGRVVVLSERLWRELFASDPRVVGASLVLDREPYTVVGVMPKGFAYPAGAELWMPLLPGVSELAENANVWWMSAVGRLKPGVTLAQARRDMEAYASAYSREKYQAPGVTAVVTPLAEALLGPTREVLLALLGGVALVLLVACANVAALQLVQVDERAPEIALRLALGASHARLGRALLAESLLLGLLGGGLGLASALAGIPLLIALSPQEVPRLAEASLDATTLTVAFSLMLLAAGLSALASIAVVRRGSLRDALAGGSRSLATGGSRMRTLLVAGEVALALVLVVGAGLLLRSFVALRDAPVGFDRANLLAFDAGASEKSYPQLAQQRLYVENLVSRVAALPGVESAAAVTLRPLWGSTVGMDWPFTIEGQSDKDAERNPMANFETVTPDYFRTMGIPLTRGRAFDERDRDGQPGVVIVSDALAHRYWPGLDPIGKRLKLPLPPTAYNLQWLTVVGVAGDARYRELTATRLDLYMPHRQSDHRPHHVVVRTRGEVAGLPAAILKTLRQLNPEQPAPRIVVMTDVVHEALAGPRFAARMLTAFALVALLLAALGLYGLVAYSVGRRSREIGLRVTLGARPAAVARLVLREGLLPAAAGVGLGLAGALAAARLVAKLLYGVGPADLATLAAAAAMLLAVAALAAALPLARALRVEPSVVLREP